MSRKRRLHVLLVTGAALGIGIVLLFNRSGSNDRSCTLPDGSVITLRGITSGTKHRFVDGNLWQRAIGKLLSDACAMKLGVVVLRDESSSPTHVLWLERSYGTNAPAGGMRVMQLTVRLTNDGGLDTHEYTLQNTRKSRGSLHGTRLWALPADRPE